MINYHYSHLLKIDGKTPGSWGFRGSPNNGKGHAQDKGHLTMIYCALNCLLILGDDLSCVNKKAIINGLSQYQMEDGRYVKRKLNERKAKVNQKTQKKKII